MITYKCTNTTNGKFYIGSAKDLIAYGKRKKSHLKDKLPYPFQRSLQANPDVYVWEYTEDSYGEPVLEQALLDMWFGKDQCYNLNKYADRPMPVPTKVLQKVAADNQQAGRGIYDPDYVNSEKYKEDRSKGGKNKTKQLVEGIGIHHPDYHNTRERKEIERATGMKMAEGKLGMFDPEVRSKINKEHGDKIKGRRLANNGKEQKLLPLGSPLPDGWSYGRIKIQHEYFEGT